MGESPLDDLPEAMSCRLSVRDLTPVFMDQRGASASSREVVAGADAGARDTPSLFVTPVPSTPAPEPEEASKTPVIDGDDDVEMLEPPTMKEDQELPDRVNQGPVDAADSLAVRQPPLEELMASLCEAAVEEDRAKRDKVHWVSQSYSAEVYDCMRQAWKREDEAKAKKEKLTKEIALYKIALGV